jgi:sensor domain CHASE-containing protein
MYKERKIMKKGKSLVFSGVAVLFVLVLILFVTSKIIIQAGYTRLEDQLVRNDMNCVLDVLSNELANLENRVIDWAEWDDTCAFVAGADTDYVRRNLPAKTFTDLGVDFMIFMDKDGRTVYGRMYEPRENKLTSIPESLRKYMTVSGPMLDFTGKEKGRNGVILLSKGPMLVSSHRIVTTKGEGPRRGTVVFSRFRFAKRKTFPHYPCKP